MNSIFDPKFGTKTNVFKLFAFLFFYWRTKYQSRNDSSEYYCINLESAQDDLFKICKINRQLLLFGENSFTIGLAWIFPYSPSFLVAQLLLEVDRIASSLVVDFGKRHIRQTAFSLLDLLRSLACFLRQPYIQEGLAGSESSFARS